MRMIKFAAVVGTFLTVTPAHAVNWAKLFNSSLSNGLETGLDITKTWNRLKDPDFGTKLFLAKPDQLPPAARLDKGAFITLLSKTTWKNTLFYPIAIKGNDGSMNMWPKGKPITSAVTRADLEEVADTWIGSCRKTSYSCSLTFGITSSSEWADEVTDYIRKLGKSEDYKNMSADEFFETYGVSKADLSAAASKLDVSLTDEIDDFQDLQSQLDELFASCKRT